MAAAGPRLRPSRGMTGDGGVGRGRGRGVGGGSGDKRGTHSGPHQAPRTHNPKKKTTTNIP